MRSTVPLREVLAVVDERINWSRRKSRYVRSRKDLPKELKQRVLHECQRDRSLFEDLRVSLGCLRNKPC